MDVCRAGVIREIRAVVDAVQMVVIIDLVMCHSAPSSFFFVSLSFIHRFYIDSIFICIGRNSLNDIIRTINTLFKYYGLGRRSISIFILRINIISFADTIIII